MRISDWSSDVCSSDLAVDVDKHVFCEKPVAVDAPGIRKVLEAVRKSKEKKLSLVSGFCWRHHSPKRAIFEKINEGAVGEISTIYNSYNTSSLWSFPRESGWNDMQYTLRRSEEHTSELQSLMRISYAVFCLKNKN